jgi:hypothetical protein
MPDPLMGFALQSISPLAQLYAVPSASALLTFRNSIVPSRKPAFRRGCRSAAPEPPAHIEEDLPECPRLQGFVPHQSPPHRAGGLDRNGHVALLGFRPSRVLSLAGMTTAFTASPLMRLPKQPTSRPIEPPTGYRFQTRLACLSRDRRPSWGSPPCDPPQKFGSVAVRESPPQAPGCVTVPSPSHL